MKKLLTILFAVALGLNLSAQDDCEPSPDLNQDGVVGMNDLLTLLTAFGDFDMDFDGIWDSVDDCVGAYDECEVCNGPGPQILGIDTIIVYYDSLYAEAIDEWWVYELYSDTLLTYLCENPGCMDPIADNYDPYAIEEDGSCVYSNGSPVCDFQTAIYFDGYTYDLVAIGDQCWFAENLRNTSYSNGDEIPTNLTSNQWHWGDYGAYTTYQDDPANLEEFGLLYNFWAVIDSRGLCPSNWHVPSDDEFKTAEITLGMTEAEANGSGWRGTNQGLIMKSSSADMPSWDGLNTTGFSALPGGAAYFSGDFQPDDPATVHSMYTQGAYWTASGGQADAIYRGFYSDNDLIYRSWTANGYGTDAGMSVRCVRD